MTPRGLENVRIAAKRTAGVEVEEVTKKIEEKSKVWGKMHR